MGGPTTGKPESFHPHLNRLGYGLFVLTAVATSSTAARIAGVVVVCLRLGPAAYFVGGVYVADWKHGFLSNGESLSTAWHVALALITFVIWAPCVVGFLFIAGKLGILTERGKTVIRDDDLSAL